MTNWKIEIKNVEFVPFAPYIVIDDVFKSNGNYRRNINRKSFRTDLIDFCYHNNNEERITSQVLLL